MIDTAGMDISKFMVGESIKYAVIIVSSVPMLVLYPFLQKFFVKGVMIGAVVNGSAQSSDPPPREVKGESNV